MAIEAAIRRFLREQSIGPCRIVVAASGGADSTALLLALAQFRTEGFEVIAAHVNHALRGADSDADQAFVTDVCRSLGIEVHTELGAVPADQIRREGVEAAARRVRYEALEQVRSRTQATFVATAHTRRDQAETVLMRFLTGSGSSRLRGIAPRTDRGVIRPLLESDRGEILSFLTEQKIIPREDASNDDERFLRNRIRHETMPRLLEINPNLVSTLCETARQVRDEAAALDAWIRQSAEGWIDEEGDSTSFALERAPADVWLIQAILARQIRRLEPSLREISARDLRRLAEELPHLKRVSVSRDLELVRERARVRLRRRTQLNAPFECRLGPGEVIDVPEIRKRLTVEVTRDAVADAIAFQLPEGDGSPEFILRSRKAGDRFHPPGRSSARSLSDFLIERRIPAEVRDSIPLLTWQGQIVCVWGVAIAEPFKVRDGSKEVYVITIEENE